MNKLVFILCEPGELLDRIRDLLDSNGIGLSAFEDAARLSEAVENLLPDLVLLDPQRMTDQEFADQLMGRTATIVFSRSLEIDERLALYSRGARRVVTGTDDLAERVADAVIKLFYRRFTVRGFREESFTHGTLQTFSLPELLQNAMREEKNLILRLRQDGLDASVRTFRGHVVSAEAQTLSGADALLKILYLASGSFTIRGYHKDEEIAPMAVSIPGILAEARFQNRAIHRFLSANAAGASNPRIELLPEEDSVETNDDSARLLELIDEETTFHELLIASPFAPMETVAHLSRLIESKKIRCGGSGEDFQTFRSEDIQFLREKLIPPEAQGGALVILGAPDSGRSAMLAAAAGNRAASLQTARSIEVARLNLKEDLSLSIVGLSVEEAFFPVMEKLSAQLIACILLVNVEETEQLEFLSYLFGKLLQLYDIPFAIGLTHCGENSAAAVKAFRQQFSVASGLPVMAVNPQSFADFRLLLQRATRQKPQAESES